MGAFLIVGKGTNFFWNGASAELHRSYIGARVVFYEKV